MEACDMSAVPKASEQPTSPKARASERRSNNFELTIEPPALCQMFGVRDPDVATRLLSQLISVLRPDLTTPVDATAIHHHALRLLHGIASTGATEELILLDAAFATDQGRGRDSSGVGFEPALDQPQVRIFDFMTMKAL